MEVLLGKDNYNPYVDLPTVLAVDFDGILYKDGIYDDYIINKLINLQSIGVYLILWSCRNLESLELHIKELQARGLVFDSINKNHPMQIEGYGEDGRKIFAHRYLDDQACGFNHDRVGIYLAQVEEFHRRRMNG